MLMCKYHLTACDILSHAVMQISFRCVKCCDAGITQLCVAVNKMDTVDWSQERFDDIVNKLSQFLRQTGFKQQSFSFVPCSGLSGDNLTKPPADAAQLAAWYTGTTLVSQIG